MIKNHKVVRLAKIHACLPVALPFFFFFLVASGSSSDKNKKTGFFEVLSFPKLRFVQYLEIRGAERTDSALKMMPPYFVFNSYFYALPVA